MYAKQRGWQRHKRPVQICVRSFVAKSTTTFLLDFEDRNSKELWRSGSGMPDTTVEPSGGVMGLIQWNTNEGRCLLENPSEMLMKAALLVLYPAAQVLWLGSHFVFSTCELQTAHVVVRRKSVFTRDTAASNQLCVAVSLVVSLFCWLGCCQWALVSDSERIGCCGKSQTSSTRKFNIFSCV